MVVHGSGQVGRYRPGVCRGCEGSRREPVQQHHVTHAQAGQQPPAPRRAALCHLGDHRLEEISPALIEGNGTIEERHRVPRGGRPSDAGREAVPLYGQVLGRADPQHTVGALQDRGLETQCRVVVAGGQAPPPVLQRADAAQRQQQRSHRRHRHERLAPTEVAEAQVVLDRQHGHAAQPGHRDGRRGQQQVQVGKPERQHPSLGGERDGPCDHGHHPQAHGLFQAPSPPEQQGHGHRDGEQPDQRSRIVVPDREAQDLAERDLTGGAVAPVGHEPPVRAGRGQVHHRREGQEDERRHAQHGGGQQAGNPFGPTGQQAAHQQARGQQRHEPGRGRNYQRGDPGRSPQRHIHRESAAR